MASAVTKLGGRGSHHVRLHIPEASTRISARLLCTAMCSGLITTGNIRIRTIWRNARAPLDRHREHLAIG